MNEEKPDPGKLETWAIVEVMGHNRFAGFVQSVALGGSAMIRVDVPAIAERWENFTDWQDNQTKRRKVAGTPAFTKFLGVSSIFAITPCSEEVARRAVEQFRSPPVTILEMPPVRGLPSPDPSDIEDEMEVEND